MTKTEKQKPYDLEERTLEFAKRVRDYVKKLPRTLTNISTLVKSGQFRIGKIRNSNLFRISILGFRI